MSDDNNMGEKDLNGSAQNIENKAVLSYEYGGTPDGTALVEEREKDIEEATEDLQAENIEMLEVDEENEESLGQRVKGLLTRRDFLIGAGTAVTALGIILSQSGCSGAPVSSVAMAPESFMATSVAATLQSNENVMPIEEATATPTVQPVESQEATPEYLSIPDKRWNESVKAYIGQFWDESLYNNLDQYRRNSTDLVYKFMTDKGGMNFSAPFVTGQEMCDSLKENTKILSEVKDEEIFKVIWEAMGYLGRDTVIFGGVENGETCYYEKEGLYFVVYYDFEDKPFRADPYVNTIPTSLDPKIQKEMLDGNMLVKVHQDGRVEGSCKGELFSYEADNSSSE